MDLKDLKPKNDIVTVNLVHPQTGEPLKHDDGKQFYVNVYAQHTRTFKESQQETIALFQKVAKERGKDATPTLLEVEDAVNAHLARITVEWDFLYDGEKPKLSVKRATELYGEIFWIKDQIQEALEKTADFTKV